VQFLFYFFFCPYYLLLSWADYSLSFVLLLIWAPQQPCLSSVCQDPSEVGLPPVVVAGAEAAWVQVSSASLFILFFWVV